MSSGGKGPPQRIEPALSEAEEVFLRHLLERDGDSDEGFEALRESRPELAAELHDVRERWAELRRGPGEPSISLDFAQHLLDKYVDRSARDERHGPARSAALELGELARWAPEVDRYLCLGEVARGGMGVVLRARDRSLDRELALKVALDSLSPAGDVPSPGSRSSLGRFVEEARITGQLDHPGIVPVHELGLDAQGRVFFAMRLVQGCDLREAFRRARRREGGWSLTRAVEALVEVCETVAFAHAKGVLHRDLKPANVMVGGFGEVYVMDWGLARVAGRREAADLRLAESPDGAVRGRGDSPILTLDGSVVGTPSYMPPEQALGRVGELDERSDVYALGAMLYALLAGRPPYVPAGSSIGPRAILAAVASGPPRPIPDADPQAPPELVSVCERAMARTAAKRYPGPQDLASDLRAWLEGRVVRAHEAGALAEVRKWIGRNRRLVATLAAALLLLLTGGAMGIYVRTSSRLELLRLAEVRELDELERTARGELWPARPDRIEAIDAWLRQARRLESELGRWRRRLADMERGLRDTGRSPDELERRQYEIYEGFVSKLADFVAPRTGTIARVEERLRFAEWLLAPDVPDYARRWAEALEAIRGDPAYGLPDFEEQKGLVPLGRDPDSGLWEFAHLETGGAIPVRGEDGRLHLTEKCGLVLVLVPGGTFLMGAELDPRGDAVPDRWACCDEGPVHEVRLESYFISKYEMTRAQWMRAAPDTPFESVPPGGEELARVAPLMPIANVNQDECGVVLRCRGLVLPTEARWEHAARAGTTTPWWTGSEPASLADAAWVGRETGEGPLPIGGLAANAFGLHDVHGNVAEWCEDQYDTYHAPWLPGDGQRCGLGPCSIVRGGGYDQPPERARSACRKDPGQRGPHVGVRPAREVQRADEKPAR